MAVPSSLIGVVVIGRNEGERLRRCLVSVGGGAMVIIYVDSGSTDGSVAVAESLGASVVALDLTRPFTAARARNVGWGRLVALTPDVKFVQFVDGDCEIVAGWLAAATGFLAQHPEVAAVCGRLRERHPDRSIYNLLCDMEWNTPVGETKASGGIVMLRSAALHQVGGYRESLIAGEEPELCIRLRKKGWHIWRVDTEMALHDAAMTRFGQWWTRSIRAGFAYAEGVRLHGAPPERHWVRELRSACVWGAGIPLLLVLAAAWFGPLMLLGFAVYPLQVLRIGLRGGASTAWARWARAFFLVVGKFPEAVGVLKSCLRRVRGGPAKLIEYK